MAFDLPRRAFEHARTQTDDRATHIVIDGLIHLLAETEEAIVALKIEVAALKRRVPGPE